jgi:hypothetical protein
MLLTLWICGFAIYQMAPLSDPDTPWHYATGLYILSHHTVPTTDPFSWTSHGKPWVTQEWLYEVVLAWLGSHFGFAGMWLLICGLHTVTVIALYRVCVQVSRGNRIIAAMAACLGTLVPLIFWTMRPQTLSYTMFAVFLWILQQVRQGRFRVLWLVLPLMLVWANAHGSAIIGVLMLCLEVAISFVPSVGRLEPLRLPPGARWRLAAAAVSGFLIGLCNPNFYKAYTYALLSTNQLMVDNINEWHSPNFHSDVFKYGILPFLAATFLVLLCRRRSLPMRETLYFGGCFAYMLIYQRFTPYMAMAAAPLLASALGDVFRWLSTLPWWIRLPNGAISLAALAYFGAQLPSVQGTVDKHWSESAYPIHAVNFLQEHHLTDKVLNAYHWGGYLIYRGVPTFVDGRTDIYLQNSVFSDYLSIKNVWWNGPALVDMYKCQVALFPSGDPIVTYLTYQPNWKVVYRDATAAILVRKEKDKS